ncbi:MAG TPA: type II toxin-antitoxin system RelE/ParE family toxin [Gammaproteobacteria bacterium]|nr:type II toxin-antitoxin system RelE/ParE family toxin [Gammaproteobacteria bacterium]
MKLKWTRRALRQLLDAQEYIAQENPAAAKQVVDRIATAASRLLYHPKMGRTGRVAGTHELIVNRTTYFIVYVLMNDTVQIVRVLHGKQDWPPKRR